VAFRWCSLAVLLFATFGVSAGVRFDFTSELSSPQYSYSGTITIDGENARVDIAEGNHPMFNAHSSIITRRRGAELVIIDHARKTWFSRQASRMAGHLAAVRGIGRATAHRERTRAERKGDEHRLYATYDISMVVEGEKIDGVVEIEAVTQLGSGVRQNALPWGLQFAAKTGFDDVDRAIARRLPAALPLKQVVTASRSLAGGEPVREMITTTVSNVTEAKIDVRIFFPPSGYTYEEPVFVFGSP
jgi:hypothetical protein